MFLTELIGEYYASEYILELDFGQGSQNSTIRKGQRIWEDHGWGMLAEATWRLSLRRIKAKEDTR